MRIVFFTREGYADDPLFSYLYARVASVYPDSHVVVVQGGARRSVLRKLQRLGRIVRQRGPVSFVETAASRPLQTFIGRRESRELTRRLGALERPSAQPPVSVTVVSTVNGPATVETIRRLAPDIILQAGAGILREQIFTIPRIATLNLHHGIAPLIRGVNSLYWALYENRPEWMGATVHRIDAGIDTGDVLAYAPLAGRVPGEGFPSLFARATEAGVDRLIDVLERLAAGERWVVYPLEGNSEYRSAMSGLRLAILDVRLWRERMRGRKLPASDGAAYTAAEQNTH